jgi:hypothetical protein
MLRRPQVIAALLIMALSPAALAQKSSGYMDIEDMSSVYGTQLAYWKTDGQRRDCKSHDI